MQKRNVRVVLATESPLARSFLRETVEKEDAVIIGQADNAVKALTLTRNLRPDVAVIDYSLPHVVGLDNVPLSRISGLDAAQAISQEIPNTRVVLVTGMAKGVSEGEGLPPDASVVFAREGNIPFKLGDLFDDSIQPGKLIFANVEVRPKGAQAPRRVDKGDAALYGGGICVLVGTGLAATMALGQVGMGIAAIGGVAMFFGAAVKLVASLRRERRWRERERQLGK
ncbi:MAG: response regulator [Chloroflexi bacterium]|nr:response regulator [Chloroflexota bacterium]